MPPIYEVWVVPSTSKLRISDVDLNQLGVDLKNTLNWIDEAGYDLLSIENIVHGNEVDGFSRTKGLLVVGKLREV